MEGGQCRHVQEQRFLPGMSARGVTAKALDLAGHSLLLVINVQRFNRSHGNMEPEYAFLRTLNWLDIQDLISMSISEIRSW